MSKQLVDELTKGLVDKGKLIEAGWVGFEIAIGIQGASDLQRSEMRKAFFAGAQHLFSSIMSFLEEGQEATDADLNRMTQVSNELNEFIAKFKDDNFV